MMKILYDKRAILLEEMGDGRVKKRHLIVSDLHIGFEEKFRSTGVQIHSSIDLLLRDLISIIGTYKIESLVINGDVKSSVDRISKSEWNNVPKFFERIPCSVEITVIPGNHDGSIKELLPERVKLEESEGKAIGDTLILHGHTRPMKRFSFCRRLIIGHIHPIYQKRGSPLSGQPVWVILHVAKSQIFEGVSGSENLEVLIMPSFNTDLVVAGYAADTSREEKRVAPITRSIRQLNDAAVITLSGDLIGDASLASQIL